MNKNGKIIDQIHPNNPVQARDRLAVVLSHSKEPTLNSLARVLQLNRAENLYQIKRGKNNISVPLAKRITEVYPEFNEGWLMTGMGEPFRVVLSRARQLPLYTALNFQTDGSLYKTDHMLTIETALCPSAELVTVCRSDAMEPRIMSGDYLFLTSVPVASVVFGRPYFVITGTYQICRIIRKSDEKDRLRLVALKSEQYDEIILPQEHIRALYRVCGVFQSFGG